MTENHTLRTDREKDAVNLNQQEERTLLKTLNTLQLEQSYVLKLLDLEKKQVKFGQKRMRAKVKAIRTHLQADDIAGLRTMEAEGTFRPEYTPVNASSVIRIAAASKRLKLLTNKQILQLVEKDIKRPLAAESTSIVSLSRASSPAVTSPAANKRMRSQSAGTRLRSDSLPKDLSCGSQSDSSHYKAKQHTVKKRTVDATGALARSHDVTGALSRYDLDSIDGLETCSSELIDNHFHENSASNPADPHNARITSASNPADPHNARITSAVTRPATKDAQALTTRGFLTVRPHTGKPLSARPPRTARPKTSLGIQSLNYCSHKVRASTEHRCRRESFLSTSSIGSEIAREKAAEFRKELLTDELRYTDCIESKRQTFLTRIQHWVAENPAIVSHGPAHSPRSRCAHSPRSRCASPLKAQETDAELSDSRWAGMRKVRYLRLADGEADLSGVTTLVIEQMKQLRGLRPGVQQCKTGVM